MHTQEHLPLPLSHVSYESLFLLARGIKEIPKVGQVVRGDEDHRPQGAEEDLEGVLP